jgi:5-methylthioribose kinase
LFEIDHTNAAQYLSSQWGYDAASLRVTPLGGGVSNTVLLVETGSRRLVLKQSLAKLRVEMDWFSERERIFRECAALRELAPHLEAGSIPSVVFEDRDNFLFAMSAAPPGARDWKSILLEGSPREETAATIGRMLASMIAAGRSNPRLEAAFGDQTVFDQLRIDPYYRTTSRRHPDLAPHFLRLIERCSARRFSLVHGDWSPKNFLVERSQVMAIDFEVIHYGDPAFDVAFFLNHLLLKSFHLPRWARLYAALADGFWNAVAQALPEEAGWLEEGAVRHLGGLLLARIDGKSPAEYIREEGVKQQVRSFARELILNPPLTLHEVFARLRRQ